MKDEVLISICIPVYNGEKFLKETIDSILMQDIENMEIIIVDDCSTDKSVDIVSSYSDKRIKLFRNSNKLGMVKNWNKTLEYSSGKYIKLMCQDDILRKNCLRIQCGMLERDENIVMVTTKNNVIGSNGKSFFNRRLFKKDCIVDGKYIAKKSLMLRNIFGEPSIVMFRSDVISKIGYFDESFRYVPDWDYWIRILYLGKLAYIDKQLASFRISQNSQTSKIIIKDRKNLMSEYKEFIKKHAALRIINITQKDIIMYKVKILPTIFLKQIFIRLLLKIS